jgi:ABC-2 type transport system permease protein
MMVVMPVVLLLLFGYAINTDVRHIPTLVDDHDRSAASRDLARRLEATGFYDRVGDVDGYDEIERALRSGRARVVLVVPPGYGADLASGATAHVQLVVDGSDPQIVGSAQSTATSLVEARSAELRVERLVRMGGRLAPAAIDLAPDILYNPDQRTAVYVVPGLIGVILTMTMVMLTAMALARERERGTLEQLVVSPVRPVELVIGKILPYVAIGYVQMTLILGFARWSPYPSGGHCRSSTRSRSSSSPRTWPSASSSRRSRRASNKRCRCRSFSSYPTSCSAASCSPSRPCRAPRSGFRRHCR